MANEIRIHATLKAEKGNTSVSALVSALTLNWTGNRFVHARQSVGTTEEALDLGDISAGGYLLAVNRDSTNYVSIRNEVGADDMIRLNAGEVALFRLHQSATAPYVIADTAACDLEYWLLEA